MTNTDISKTVRINEAFFEANPGLRNELQGTTINADNLPGTINESFNKVWTALIKAVPDLPELEPITEAAPELEAEPTPTQEEEPTPTQEEEPTPTQEKPKPEPEESNSTFSWW
jgi:hypothetical protein